LLDRLSPLRDAQVQIRALPSLTNAHPQAEELGDVLRARKRELTRTAAKHLARFDGDALTSDLEELADRLSPAPLRAALGEVLDAALTGDLAKRHLRAVRDWQAATAEDPKSLHRVRLSLKGYRYALEALGPILPSSARELSQGVARLQDQLGAAHDAHVLAETARASVKARRVRHPGRLEGLVSDLEKASRAAQLNGESSLRGSTLEWPAPVR
jgi:CHAD domain-containing protein